ncbi:MAG: 3-deoxy-7-phosphoheptulonate synthase [Polyangiaceae bacterium]|nr:3-deoxy-7-phosphoheptulonate synthase [Polyangiaceae bacterium]
MIIVLKPGSKEDVVRELCDRIAKRGLEPLHLPGSERVVLGAIGDERLLADLQLESHPDVESVKPILSPYKLVSRELQSHDTVVRLGERAIGAGAFAILAGPCAIESHEQLDATARAVREAGGTGLRGGAFKPRTSPYAFQGTGREGLSILSRVSKEVGLPSVTEVLDPRDVDVVVDHADMLQIGARNMQNFELLRAVGRAGRPVLLKRGMSARLEELLLAAEYIVAAGNPNVVLCERGIRTFETATRNTLDLAAVPYLKQRSHLPVLVDPSHATGLRELVGPMVRAAAAAGADGVIVEIHPDPSRALSDGRQSLDLQTFARLVRDLRPLLAALGKEVA